MFEYHRYHPSLWQGSDATGETMCVSVCQCKWVCDRKQHVAGVLALKRFVPVIEFSSHCGGSLKGESFQPEGFWGNYLGSGCTQRNDSLNHKNKVTCSAVFPACPYIHYTWLDRVTVKNHLAHFFFIKAFFHIHMLSSRCRGSSVLSQNPQRWNGVKRPIIKIKSQRAFDYEWIRICRGLWN